MTIDRLWKRSHYSIRGLNCNVSIWGDRVLQVVIDEKLTLFGISMCLLLSRFKQSLLLIYMFSSLTSMSHLL